MSCRSVHGACAARDALMSQSPPDGGGIPPNSQDPPDSDDADLQAFRQKIREAAGKIVLKS